MLIIDAHVHIYACFDLNTFVESAFRNFEKAAGAQQADQFSAVITIADWSGASWFEKLAELGREQQKKDLNTARFRIQATGEDESLRISNKQGQEILIVAGRKIITSEDMEVLALCSKATIADGRPLEKTVRTIAGLGAVPVIPWAVGKWLGQRGTVLDDLMNLEDRPFFYLCDNGNRPFFWGKPRHFAAAQKKSIPIISGSDPLHFPAEAHRAGAFGFTIPGNLSSEAPARDLRNILLHSNLPIRHYGRLERFVPFLSNQVRMQLFKKKWRRELLK
jgi:hypothetical protein